MCHFDQFSYHHSFLLVYIFRNLKLSIHQGLVYADTFEKNHEILLGGTCDSYYYE